MGQMGSAPFASTRRRRRDGGAFSPLALYANGEAGGWYDPSDLTPEKVSWRRNLLTYSEQFDNSAWTKSNASILSNLVLWSQDFDNAAWNLFNATVTANTTVAPDGTTTADTVTTNTNPASNGIWQSVTVTASTQYTFSFYARRGTATDLKYSVYNNTGGADIVAATSYYSSTSSTDWSRITLTFTTPVGCTSIRVYPVRDAGSLGTMFIWGAQLVPGTTAQTYTPTTSAAAPIPFTAPDGSATADALVENTANSSHLTYNTSSVTVANATAYTYSIYAKSAGRSWINLVPSFSAASAYFDVQNGVVGTVTNGTGSIVSVGSGWFRCVLTFTSNATSGFLFTQLASANGTNSYTGDGSSGVLFWGAQLEAAPTASSYQRITDFTSDFLAAFPQHALYQDSAGTTPVTALGQPVGLVLDKSKGGLASLGSNAVTNAWENGFSTAFDTFTGTTSGFTATTTGARSGIRVRALSSLVIGRSYAIEFTLAYTNATLTELVYATGFYGGASTIQSPCSAGNGIRYRVIGTVASSSSSVMLILAATGAATVTMTDFSVREVPGAHAIQATSASRPTCDARVNLLTYSEQLENAAWVRINSTVTANTAVAPDGTTTADKLIADTTSGAHLITQVLPLSVAPYTLSVFAKAAEYTSLRLNYVSSGNAAGDFNLTNGTSAVSGTNGLSTSITLIGNGWYRCSFTFTGRVTSGELNVVLTNPSGTVVFAGNGTDGVLVWGAQLDVGSTATTYQRVVTASDYADVQAPRYLTFDGIDDSLYTAASVDFATWTSGTRRNLLTYPSAFDNSAWTKVSASVTANNVVAPDGTTTGDTVAATVTGVGARIQQDNTVSATGQYVYSCYLRRDNVNTAVLRIFNNTSSTNLAEVTFNVQNGTVSSTVAGSGAITNVGSGWYRCEVTHTGSVTGGNSIRVYVYPNNTSPTSGDAVATWGAQLELGSTATAFQDVGTDKMTVVTGVRKLVDSGAPTLVELSAAGDSNNGAFMLRAPWVAVGSYYWSSRGTSNGGTSTPEALYPAPITNVLTCGGDIAGDIASFRVNGISATTGINDQGAGTYGTYVLFIGRRNNATNPFNGRLYQLLVRGAQTDTATVQQTERFVAGKTGVTL